MIKGAGDESGGTDEDDDDDYDDDADYKTLFEEMKKGDTSHAVSKSTVVTENGVVRDPSSSVKGGASTTSKAVSQSQKSQRSQKSQKSLKSEKSQKSAKSGTATENEEEE